MVTLRDQPSLWPLVSAVQMHHGGSGEVVRACECGKRVGCAAGPGSSLTARPPGSWLLWSWGAPVVVGGVPGQRRGEVAGARRR